MSYKQSCLDKSFHRVAAIALGITPRQWYLAFKQTKNKNINSKFPYPTED